MLINVNCGGKMQTQSFIPNKKSENPPLVSVVVCSRNRPGLVTRALDSILMQQTDFGFEIIVGDDHSDSFTRDILQVYQRNYPDVIRLVLHEENIGVAANWAVCVQQARGRYIAQCDDDDSWHNCQKLQKQIDYLEENPDCGVCYTDFRILDSRGKHHIAIIHNIKYGHSLLETLLHTNKFRCCASTVVYRAEVLLQYVPLADYIKYRFTLQDWGTWCFLAEKTRFYCMPFVSATYSIAGAGITHQKRYAALLSRMIREKQLYRYVCENTQHVPYDEAYYDCYIHRTMLAMCYRERDFKRARQHADYLKNNNCKTLKTFAAQWKTTFLLFILAKNIRAGIRNIVQEFTE